MNAPSVARRVFGSDAVIGLGVGGVALLLYLRTLLPHLGGSEDTPKFQYLGAVLGTAHSPGYPLYVMVSFLFAQLPFGTLAYRINVMSACFGAIAVMFCFLCARRLGCTRLVAAAMAMALAGGRYFWGNAVIAEVYTLNAALWMAALWKLVQWDATGRDRDLYAATVFAAIGVGNHLTIVCLGPAALACLFLSGRRWWRVRPLLVCSGILAVGVAQYTFVWLRTLQRGSHLESRASTVQDLVSVMTARNYSDIMFGFGIQALLTERVPALWSVVRTEMGYTGVAAALIGLAILVKKRPSGGALLGVAAAGVLVVTANVVADLGGFLLPVFATMWVAAAVAMDKGLAAARVRRGRLASYSVVALVAAIPGVQVLANYAVNDHHRQQLETQFVGALFRTLPPRTALLTSDYTLSEMIEYGIVSGDFRREGPPPESAGTDPDTVRRVIADGLTVVAFPNAVAQLRGSGFFFLPFRLLGPTLHDYVHDLQDGSIVVAAATGVDFPVAFTDVLRGVATRRPGQQPIFALVAVKGRGGLVPDHGGTGWIELALPGGATLGGTNARMPVDVVAAATPAAAQVTIGGRDIARSSRGVVLAVLDRDGRVLDDHRFEARHEFRADVPSGTWQPTVVTVNEQCSQIGNHDWRDVTDVAREAGLEGRIDNARPYNASMLFYAASTQPVRPRIANVFRGCQGADPCPSIDDPELLSEAYRLDVPGDPERLRARLQADGWTGPDGWLRAANVHRVEVRLNDQGQFATFLLRLGTAPDRLYAQARTDVANPHRAIVCGLSPEGLFAAGERDREVDLEADREVVFESGWGRPEAAGPERFRRIDAPIATLAATIAHTGPIRVTLQTRALDPAVAAGTLRLTVNGNPTAPLLVEADARDYEWTIPAAAWRRGVNRIDVHVALRRSPPAPAAGERLGAIAVRQLRFELLQASASR